MKLSKMGLLLIIIVSTLMSILGITSLIISYKVASWIKNIEQIKLGYFEVFKKYSLEINILAVFFIILVILAIFILLRTIQRNILKLITVLSFIFTVVIGTYLFLCLIIYQNINEIIEMNHMVYQPKKIDRSDLDKINYGNFEEIEINAIDNIKLHGWLINNSNELKSPLIIYFGGSGEEVSDMMSIADKLDGWSVALVNYRSYGLSEGEPNKDNLYNDANLIYDYFSKRSDIDSKKIVSMGYSLGTGIAVNLSSERPTVSTILVSPYDNYSKLKSEKISNILKLHNMFPLSLFVKESFNSISKAPSIHTPLLCLAGDLDRNIPIEYSKNLVAEWGGEKKMKTIHYGDHFFMFSSVDAWAEITSFLNDQIHPQTRGY
ncbi:alpha/beta hydrolase [Paenibacillus planticolens]|uniref:Prolyl oligopeptidase family serine peptidase n=1 Tax=Paenibacillus planticolens TaxID=2654976 RepID=A0ABX1ZFA8_9BACL|nr:prolyl oligopeptidase family serine peptidase [Paenibacillus planticolens]NOU98779.1 prolyl oligopeptidase family serine peptidase [Paenibacillus planticolens]